MTDYAPPLNSETMFRGRCLPDFLRTYQDHFAWIIQEYGRERFDRVYDWIFNLLTTQMSFGQWIVVEKICPDPHLRPLLYFVLELIYQSDMLSQFHFERCVPAPSLPSDATNGSNLSTSPTPSLRALPARTEGSNSPSSPSQPSLAAPKVSELRVIMDPPPPNIRRILAPGSIRYPLVDWYSRLRLDPYCDPEIDPSWLGL